VKAYSAYLSPNIFKTFVGESLSFKNIEFDYFNWTYLENFVFAELSDAVLGWKIPLCP
jgi:hypothetical protein